MEAIAPNTSAVTLVQGPLPPGVEQLVNHLLSYPALLVVVATWAIMQYADKLFPKFFARPIVIRLKHVAAPLFTIGGMFIPGLFGGMLWGERILTGIILGLGVDKAHQILKHTIFGDTEPNSALIKKVKDILT